MLREPIRTGRLAWALLGLFVIYWLYFHGLTAAGLIGPDEPRYAAIGRQMALSGDWVTPRLWGEPWFEKPALLYWLIAAAFRLGLSADLAPRLPIVTLSVAFLAFYGWRLRREFGTTVAALATVLLATSAGWLGYSFVAVTDLPLAAAFSAALLLALDWIRAGSRRMAVAVGALLGVAVLAKGLVPLALAAPLIWFSRRRARDWWLVVAGCLAVAAPWYILCSLRNGPALIQELFGKHTFGRFFSGALKHGQPKWFYLPVLAGGLFPWTPSLLLLASRRTLADAPRQLLAATVVFGFVLFSASENKLPGYLLPLIPALVALVALRLAESPRRTEVLAAGVVLVGLLPLVAQILPRALESGIRRSGFPASALLWLLPAALLALGCLIAGRWRRWWLPAAVTAGIMTAAVIAFKLTAAPLLEQTSIRPLARSIETEKRAVCVGPLHRALRYGLNYYTLQPLPDCSVDPRPWRIEQVPGNRPRLLASPSASTPPSGRS